MASLARASHFSSRRSCSSAWVAKNFVLFRAGCPSGFKRLAAIRIGISCNSKPRNQAAWVASRRAGTIFQLRNSACSDVVFIVYLSWVKSLRSVATAQVYGKHKTVPGPSGLSGHLNQSRLGPAAGGQVWRSFSRFLQGRELVAKLLSERTQLRMEIKQTAQQLLTG